MTEQIGSLSVDLAVDIADYQKNLRLATAELQRASASWSSGFGKMRDGIESVFTPMRAFTGLLAGAGVYAFAHFVKGAIDAGDRLAKTASAVDVNVESLQELSYAANLSGVGVEQLYKSLGIFTRNLGDARDGTGELSSKLKESNPELLRALLGAKNTGDAFRVAADALAKTTDATARASLATALFGREGLKLVNLTKDGSAGLDAMAREARDLGLVLDQNAVRKLEEANDSLGRVSAATLVFGEHLAAKLSPALVEAGDALAGFIGQAGRTLFPTATEELDGLKRGLEEGVAALARLNRERETQLRLIDDGTILQRMGARIALGGINEEIAATQEGIAQLTAQIGLRQKDIDATKGQEQARAGHTRTISLETAALNAEAALYVAAALPALAAYTRLTEEATRTREEAKTATEKLADQTARLDEQLAAGLITLEERNRVLERATIEAAHATDGQAELAQSLQKSQEMARQLGLTFGDSFADAIIDGKRVDEVIRALERDVARLVARAAVTNLISSALGGAPTGGGEIIGGINVGPRAMGGPVAGGSAYIVGENGPEMFVAPRDGQIIPNRDLGGATLNFDFRGADASVIPRVEAMIRAAAPQIIAQSVAAVSDTRRRGGRV